MLLVYDKHADTLANLASNIDVPDKVVDVKIIKKTSGTIALCSAIRFNGQDRRNSIIQNLNQPSSSTAVKNFKDFMVMTSYIIEAMVEC